MKLKRRLNVVSALSTHLTPKIVSRNGRKKVIKESVKRMTMTIINHLKGKRVPVFIPFLNARSFKTLSRSYRECIRKPTANGNNPEDKQDISRMYH